MYNHRLDKWQVHTIGEICPFNYGKSLPEKVRDKNGRTPVYGSNGIFGLHSQAFVNEPCIIIGRKGTVGAISYSQMPCWPIDTTFYVKSSLKSDLRFLYYMLKTLGLEHMNSDSAVPGLNRSSAHNKLISIPPLAEQKAIAHILGTLDDKIELNRKMNETLETMAQAIFKSWFVDFEPVRAKMEGRWQPSQSLPGLPANLYDLFPDKLVDSELGEIPEGWEVKKIFQLFEVYIGKTPPRNEQHWFSKSPKDLPWMSIKDLGKTSVYITQVSEFLTREGVKKFRIRVIPDNTVVLSFKLTLGRVAITDGIMLSNEAIAHFIPIEGMPINSEFIYNYLKQFNFKSLGSTSSIATAINSENIRAMSFLLPSWHILAKFEDKIKSIFKQIKIIQNQNTNLFSIRDTLLPKLISGEIRVKDAEKFLEIRGIL